MLLLQFLGWLIFPWILLIFYWKKIKVSTKAIIMAWSVIIFVGGVTSNNSDITTVEKIDVSPIPQVNMINTSSKQPPVVSKSIDQNPQKSSMVETKKNVTIYFPADQYPETAAHIQSSITKGKSAICTIDRDGADENRNNSLGNTTTKEGYDRDEWPMAICDEGGKGADIAYVKPSDNRGAGSWVKNQLQGYADGTKVLFVIEGKKKIISSKNPIVEKEQIQQSTIWESDKASVIKEEIKEKSEKEEVKIEEPEVTEVYYKNCTAARKAGAAPIYEGEPGYSLKLDRDKDGVACER